MATQLPDGTAVVQPPGKRAVVPVGDGTQVRTPNVAAGGGPGVKGKSSLPPKQKGRAAAPKNAIR